MATAFMVVLALSGFSSATLAQGFGKFKKQTIKLERKLPAAITLPGPALEVRVRFHQRKYADLAQTFSDLLITELQKDNPRIHLAESSPDAIVRCTILDIQTPPPVPFVRNDVVGGNGKYNKITGEATVSYSARDGSGRILDSDNIVANYSQAFEAGTNAADESVPTKIASPFKRMVGKKTNETYGPPNAVQLREMLLEDAVHQVASRLVNTSETIEVTLARGKQLSRADKLADSRLWQRYVEVLETMTPLPTAPEDAFRQYDMGVGYEALAYQSADHAVAKKLLEQAAIAYGKAMDNRPGEKYFMDAQTRIETAVAHYEKLASRPNLAEGESPARRARSVSGRTQVADSDSNTSSSTSRRIRRARAIQKPALTNDEVIKMFKAGVDEDSVIAAIGAAPSVNFDLSPDGLIVLAKNGVKGRIVRAMRLRQTRARRRPVLHSSSD
jgi:hypothetical protein